MRLPVPSFLATSNVTINITNGTDENGSPNITDVLDVKARMEPSNSTVYTSEGMKMTLRAKLFIFDKLDKFPDKASGFCIINGERYEIAEIRKHLNPDANPNASVHHIVLELV